MRGGGERSLLDQLLQLSEDVDDPTDYHRNQFLMEEIQRRRLENEDLLSRLHSISSAEAGESNPETDAELTALTLSGRMRRSRRPSLVLVYLRFLRLSLTPKRTWKKDLIHRSHVCSEILSGIPLRRAATVIGAVSQFSRYASTTAVVGERWLWLAQIVVNGGGSTLLEASHVRVAQELGGSHGVRRWILQQVVEAHKGPDGYIYSAIEVIRGVTLIDISSLAKSRLLTGIQRVSLELASELYRTSNVHVVHWNSSTKSFKRLEVSEDISFEEAWRIGFREENGATIIPLECSFIEPEVVSEESRLDFLELTLQANVFSSSLAVVYDLIPIRRPDLVGTGTVDSFVRYLNVIRRFTHLAPISKATDRELRAWMSIYFDARGEGSVIEPAVLPVTRPSDSLDPDDIRAAIKEEKTRFRGQQRLVIFGTFEPRKNQIRALQACELLWKKGYSFEAVLVGFGGWPEYPVQRAVELLVRKRRLVSIRQRVSDLELSVLLGSADAVVYVSLAEGFGLPVVEARSMGAPVVASRLPSIVEISDEGTVLVDPMDPDDIAHGITVALSTGRLEFSGSGAAEDSWNRYARDILRIVGGESVDSQ